MTNSISPLLQPVDVTAYEHSILSLEFDEISDLVFYQDRVWFLWHIRPTESQQERKQSFFGTVGIASCVIGADNRLLSVKKCQLPVPTTAVPINARALTPEYKIATTVGGGLVVVLTLKYQFANQVIKADSVVFKFSPETEKWSLGAYGRVTKKFRFHPVESASDISEDTFAAVTLSNNLIVYTHQDEVFAGFDDTRYDKSEWRRSPEVSRLLDLAFAQKIRMLYPFAAPFIFLNNDVPWDEQIKEPVGGKSLYLPAFDSRVLLFYNYETIPEAGFAPAGERQTSKFKWPGLCVFKDSIYNFVFALIDSQSTAVKPRLIHFAVPADVLEKSAMQHTCGKDIFTCVAGFCTFLPAAADGAST